MDMPTLGAFEPFAKTELETSIPARFEAKVRRYADRIALRSGDQHVSYRTLNESANRLARVLYNDHGNHSAPVALLFSPGIEPIITILSILKAGSIYVPLNPSYPLTKLARMFEDSCASVMVTDAKNLALAETLCTAGSTARIIVLDNISSNKSVENLELFIPANTPATILYTSGSTGKPKGVVHSHRTILSEIRNYTNGLSICAQDRLSLTRPVTLSAAVRNLYGALLNGATLCHFDLQKFGLTEMTRWLIRERITILRTAASTFRQLANGLSRQNLFPDLRVIFLAAEPVYRSDVELYRKHFNFDCVLINGLGSTETFTYCYNFIDKETSIDTFGVPVGFPLDGVEVCLMDENRQVAPGEIGK